MTDVGRRNGRTRRAYASVALTDNVQKLAGGTSMSTLRASMLDRTAVVEALERKPPGVPRKRARGRH
jgi:hypothetical protein